MEGQLEVEILVPANIVSGEVFQINRSDNFRTDISGLNKIQFSAANRVCVFLTYNGKQRTVEPLSFRTSLSTGNQLFYGYEREAGHVKAYSISQIQSVEISNLPYTEKYPVEINPTGKISMPPLRRIAGGSSTKRLRAPSRRSTSSDRPYKVQCPVCQKTFSRAKITNTKLNKHKNQYGTVCSGKRGFIVN